MPKIDNNAVFIS